MSRETVEPTVTESESTGASRHSARTTETHPAFAVAKVTRAQGTPRVLFQSDLQHGHTIVLTIMRAERDRELNRDWLFGRKQLVEIEMSLSQWGALVSSIGLGSGVPVTLRATESEPTVPGLPYAPRIAENVAETRGAVNKLLARARETLTRLESAIESRAGVREMRAALSAHKASIEHAESNSEFAVTSLKEAAEAVTSQARSDIEAQILEATRAVGIRPSLEGWQSSLPLEVTAGEEAER